MLHTGIALFDFDGTIVKGDSIVPFICYSALKGFAPPWASFKAVWAYIRYGLKLIDDLKAKEEALSFLKGKPKSAADALSERFYQDVLKKRLFPEALKELEQCRQDGLIVLIVSASPDVYMHAVKNGLGVQAVIATRCALDADDVYLGRLASQNCKGFEKTLRVAEYLAALGIEPDMASSRSYGDTLSDVPMLRLTRFATLVNGSRRAIRETADLRHVTWGKK